MKSIITFVLILVINLSAQAQELLSAAELLNKSLAHHDPDNQWYQRNHTLDLVSKRPSGDDRLTKVLLHHKGATFGMEMERDGHAINTQLKNGNCTATVDGASEYTDEQAEKYRLSCEGITRWRDYHGYMLGMPMNLKDPGTILDPMAKRTTFMGEDVIALRVTYDEAVGSDIWYFYLDLDTYALIGTRFYHDESKNDGEYLTFEGEIEVDGIRLPQSRKWYYNNNDEFLGEDVVKEILNVE